MNRLWCPPLLIAAICLMIMGGPALGHAAESSWEAQMDEALALYSRGYAAEAAAAGERAHEQAVLTHGPTHPDAASSASLLAALYQAQGRYGEARPLYAMAARLYGQVLGEDHPHVVELRETLATLPARSRLSRPSRPPAEPSHQQTATLSLSTGYRVDDLDWNIAGDSSGQNPNILSELTWSDLQSFQTQLRSTYTVENFLYLRTAAAYGRILNGENQDSDYDGDNRTLESSRSNNQSDMGSVIDLSVGLGYPWRFGRDRLAVAPLAGYSYHEQNLRITDGFQTIPATGPFAGLNSKYETVWRGPWVGLDAAWSMTPKLALSGSFEYHWADYVAEADWNLRTDFQHPKSFEHTADGQGTVVSLSLVYTWTDRWRFLLTGDLQDWETDAGVDQTFFTSGAAPVTRLNEVNWNAYAISVGAAYEW